MSEDGDEYRQLSPDDTGSVYLQDLGTDHKRHADVDPEDEDGLELFPDMAELLTDDDDNNFTSYDIISRTLHQLARDGNSAVLASALARLGDQAASRINKLDGDRLAPLHYAARYSHPAAITALLQAGAIVNIRGQDSLTPLHCATRYRKSIKPSRARKLSPIPRDRNEVLAPSNGNNNEDINQLTVRSINSLTPSIAGGDSFGLSADDSVVKLLVENGAEVNSVDMYDLTPLHFACMRGNDVALRDLLSYPQLNIEARDKQMMTALSLAATFGNLDAIRQLLLTEANIICRDEEYQTPLHHAAAEGHLKICELLLDACHKKGNKELVQELVTARDSERMTALYFAVSNGHLEIAARLLQEGADPNVTRDTLATPLHAAAASGSEDLVNLLVESGARVNTVDCEQQTPLHRAAQHNMAGPMAALLDHGAIIDRRDSNSFTPLLLAVSEGHTAVTELLLQRGANVQAVDKDEKTVVFWCAAEGNVKTLKKLLEDSRCLELLDTSDRYDNSPLHEAARRGFVKTVQALLDAGSLIDNKNEDEETALHIAAEEGRNKVVQVLVKRYRYLLNDENEDSDTPLHLACLKGYSEVVRTLLEIGADVSARNTLLWTPLDSAAHAGHVDCVLLLLDHDAPLDPIDKRRTTPLQLAGKGGHVDVVQKLLERGASLTSCDATGRNALEIAIAANRKDVVMTMIKSSQWLDALRHCRVSSKGRRVTPFRMMIKRFPDAAEYVLDRCTTANGEDPDSASFGIKFNFELLDDSYELMLADDDSQLVGSSYVPKQPYDEEGELMDEAVLYTHDMRELKINHPLNLMVTYRRPNLLGHPVSVALVKHKWMSTGRYLYYFNLIFYLVFLSFLTTYVLNVPDWASSLSGLPSNSTVDTDSCESVESELNLRTDAYISSGKWAILVMALLNILRELFQIYQARLHYLGFENLLEWVCYVCAVLLVWDFSVCVIREDWQWQVGAMAIFLAWLNLLLFIRKFPYFGIYVVMFTDVFATFSKFFVVFFLFIIAFALSFYMVLKGHPAFTNPGSSLVKTSVMMIGEFEYDSIFNDPDSPLPYPGVTWLLFVIFLILMSIIIMNLLVGLAVDDIKAVQEQAVLKRLGMQTMLVLEVETVLPSVLRRVTARPYKIVHPNARHSPMSKLFRDSKVLRSFQFLSASEEGYVVDPRITERMLSEEMSETERLSLSVADLSTQLEEIRAQNIRSQALLTSLLAFLNTSREEKETAEQLPEDEVL